MHSNLACLLQGAMVLVILKDRRTANCASAPFIIFRPGVIELIVSVPVVSIVKLIRVAVIL